MTETHIPLEELVERRVYRLQARNLNFGVWNGREFLGVREKFGSRFLDNCEVPGATAFALEDTGITVPEEMPIECYLGSIDEVTGRDVDFDKPVRSGGKGWFFVDTGEASDKIRAVAVGNRQLYEFMEKIESTNGRL